MRTLIVLTLLLALAGCAHSRPNHDNYTYVWTKEGGTKHELARAESQCWERATNLTSSRLGYAAFKKSFHFTYEQCVTGEGWDMNSKTEPKKKPRWYEDAPKT